MGALARVGIVISRKRPVSNPHVIKFNSARAMGKSRFRCLRSLHRIIEQLENSLRRGHRCLQDVVLFAEVLNRTEKALCILHKRNKHAERGYIADNSVRAEPDYARYRNRR